MLINVYDNSEWITKTLMSLVNHESWEIGMEIVSLQYLTLCFITVHKLM